MFKYLRRAANPVPAELELESDSSVETSEEASVALEEPASPLRIEAMSLDPDPDPVGVSEVGSVRPDAPLELEEPASPVRIEAMSLELGFSDGEEDPDEEGSLRPARIEAMSEEPVPVSVPEEVELVSEVELEDPAMRAAICSGVSPDPAPEPEADDDELVVGTPVGAGTEVENGTGASMVVVREQLVLGK